MANHCFELHLRCHRLGFDVFGIKGFDWLSPKKWFRDVEYEVARDIGRETVQYVNRAYKYYLARKTIEERDALHRAAVKSAKGKAKIVE